MEDSARRRLEKELADIYAHPPPNISFGPIGDDIFHCQGIIIGPVGTILEGCTFHLSIQFPIDYPFQPPKVQFQTKVCHPNISVNGTVDINILGDQWSSALTTEDLLMSICSILLDPIVGDDQNPILNLHQREKKARGRKHNYDHDRRVEREVQMHGCEAYEEAPCEKVMDQQEEASQELGPSSRVKLNHPTSHVPSNVTDPVKTRLLRFWSRIKSFLIRIQSIGCKTGRREMQFKRYSLKIHEDK